MAEHLIPVTIITGFLGSGKTTVLNHLLLDRELTDTAVVVNEFGEIGLDHLLVESARDQMVLMDNGCLCCSVRGDLVNTLADLLRRVAEGGVPPFRRVIIETTGLADPAPIVQTLVSNAETAQRFRLKGIVATVDGINGVATLDNYDEARCQVAMADLIAITKADMSEADIGAVTRATRALNLTAPIEIVSDGRISPNVIVSVEATKMRAAPDLQVSGSNGHGQGHEHDHGHAHHHGHNWNIESASIVIDGPIAWSTLKDWLEWLTALRGPDVLRVKGLIRVAGYEGPVVIHGVQHVFHTPHELIDWPDEDERSRIVLIARDIPETALRASLARFRMQDHDQFTTA